MVIKEIHKLTTCDPNEQHQASSASVIGCMVGRQFATRRQIIAEAKRRLAKHDASVPRRERLGADPFECVAETKAGEVRFSF